MKGVEENRLLRERLMMYRSLILAVQKAGGSGEADYLNMTVADLIEALGQNGVRFVALTDEERDDEGGVELL